MKNKLRALQLRSQKSAAKAAAISAGLVVASPAFANEEIASAINASLESGSANVTTVVVGIVGIAAIALGLSIILGLMRKS